MHYSAVLWTLPVFCRYCTIHVLVTMQWQACIFNIIIIIIFCGWEGRIRNFLEEWESFIFLFIQAQMWVLWRSPWKTTDWGTPSPVETTSRELPTIMWLFHGLKSSWLSWVTEDNLIQEFHHSMGKPFTISMETNMLTKQWFRWVRFPGRWTGRVKVK